VTKSVGIEETRILLETGCTEFGENRMEVARPKIEALGEAARWRMIGSVQRRKARDIVALFDTIDSIDRVELAEALQQRCAEQDRTLAVLLEVNVSGEAAKHGFHPDEVGETLTAMRRFERLRVEGLMTMAPFDAPEDVVRGIFRGLRELADRHELPELSMGMSDDFEIAIEEGSTQVRIGRALFQ
jgi:hypothetical protein